MGTNCSKERLSSIVNKTLKNGILMLKYTSKESDFAPTPPPMLIFSPKSTDQNFEIAILFRIVKNHNYYVFGNDLLPHSPWGRSCK